MTDQSIKQQIVSKGSTAPRVTVADIKYNIASEHYFTAADGDNSESDTAVSIGDVDGKSYKSLRLLTFCILVLRNGFTVVGTTACVSPENFDAAEGRKYARENAVEKVWPLMGYALKEMLSMLKEAKGV